MKKLIAILLALVMVLAMAACSDATEEKKPADKTETQEPAKTYTDEEINAKSEGVMTWEEYMAAELEAEVVVECYVQGHQSWWDGKVTVYAEDISGGYFMYELACEEADAEKLVPGTKIRVTGYKAEWEGEVEIIDATFEFVDDGITYVAQAQDVTALLGTEELIEKQNMLVAFNGVTIKDISYKNDEPGDDIYVTVTYEEADYSFCVERYLTDPETELYKAFAELQAGDVVNIEGFAYWYQGINTHITAVSVA